MFAGFFSSSIWSQNDALKKHNSPYKDAANNHSEEQVQDLNEFVCDTLFDILCENKTLGEKAGRKG